VAECADWEASMITNVPTAATSSVPSPIAFRQPAGRSYAHAHWYFLAAFLAIVAGFWPTFYRPLGSGTTLKNVHGVTASLWYFVLMAQSWLMARGLVRWHRRVAMSAIVLLPLLSITALGNTSAMLTASIIPPEGRPIIAFIDFQLIAQLWALVGLGLLNRRTPAAHKRFMAATALPGLSPALARLFGRLGIAFFGPIQTTLLTADLILLVLIAVDWRMGEKRLAYPLLLVWNIAIQLLIMPLAATSAWLAFCRGFAS
jgi:uncharacterized membrane protein YozB (DUF420 family)